MALNVLAPEWNPYARPSLSDLDDVSPPTPPTAQSQACACGLETRGVWLVPRRPCGVTGGLVQNSLTHVFSFLARADFDIKGRPSVSLCSLGRCSRASRRVKELCEADFLWKRICETQWPKYYRGRDWLADASAAASRAEKEAPTWRRQFIEKEQMRFQSLGIFFMQASLQIGRPFGLHWFEPRYRWLAAKCQTTASPTMCYATVYPEEGKTVFICRMPRIDILQDGRANVELLPVARAEIVRCWDEPVPGMESRVPQLVCAELLELPNVTQPAASLSRATRLRELLEQVQAQGLTLEEMPQELLQHLLRDHAELAEYEEEDAQDFREWEEEEEEEEDNDDADPAGWVPTTFDLAQE